MITHGYCLLSDTKQLKKALNDMHSDQYNAFLREHNQIKRTTYNPKRYETSSQAAFITAGFHSRIVTYPSRFFLHENGCLSETKILKIDPKVQNRPSRQGLQMGLLQNPGSYSKKTDF